MYRTAYWLGEPLLRRSKLMMMMELDCSGLEYSLASVSPSRGSMTVVYSQISLLWSLMEKGTSQPFSSALANVILRVICTTKLMAADWVPGREVCIYVTDRAWPCDSNTTPPTPPPPTHPSLPDKRVTEDTMEKKRATSVHKPSPPLSPPNCFSQAERGVSQRLPESGGSPLAFVHFSPVFQPGPILPPGRESPVPVWLRLHSTEATGLKSLEVDANINPQKNNFHRLSLYVCYCSQQGIQQLLYAWMLDLIWSLIC